MSRRPATVTQSDVARVIRAAKQAGAPAVQVCGNVITILLNAPPAPAVEPPPSDDIVL
jgi:hypothetical protein